MTTKAYKTFSECFGALTRTEREVVRRELIAALNLNKSQTNYVFYVNKVKLWKYSEVKRINTTFKRYGVEWKPIEYLVRG